MQKDLTEVKIYQKVFFGGEGYFFLKHLVRCVFETETTKPFIVPEMTCKSHSRSLAMAQFNRPRRLSLSLT